MFFIFNYISSEDSNFNNNLLLSEMPLFNKRVIMGATGNQPALLETRALY